MKNSKNKIDFLIVEDDFDTVQLLKEFLESQGYSCKGARNVNSALEIIENCTPSIILLDILLPDKKGYELIKTVKLNSKNDKMLFYFLTAIPHSEAVEKMRRYGADGVITKPFDLKKIESLFQLIDNT